MSYQHQPLSQRDSLSSQDATALSSLDAATVSSHNSLQSQNQKLLSSRHSSTRSALSDNTDSGNSSNNNNKSKPMSNVKKRKNLQKNKNKDNHKDPPVATLSPIPSSTLFNKKRKSFNNDDDLSLTDDIYNNNNLVINNKPIPVPSNSSLKNIDTDTEDNIEDISDDPLNLTAVRHSNPIKDVNFNVISVSTLKPSQFKQASKDNRENSSTPNHGNLDIATPSPQPQTEPHPQAQAQAQRQMQAQRQLRVLSESIGDNGGDVIPLNVVSKQPKKTKKKKKKKKHKPNKLFGCIIKCKTSYQTYEQESVCCSKLRDIQKWGRIWITTRGWFRWFILVCIVVNCVFIALDNPTAPADDPRNLIVKQSEIVFAIIFTIEMAIKMFCNGLFGNHMNYDQSNISKDELSPSSLNSNDKEKEPSQNPINQISRKDTMSYSHDTDMKHNIELEAIHGPLDIESNIKNTSTKPNDNSVSESQPKYSSESSTSISSYNSSSPSSQISLSTSKQQNDRDPNRYVGYFRDNWNILDFIIVVTSWIEFLPIPAGSNLTAIRVLRVLRPLRTFTKIKALKVLIATIMLSLKGLRDVMFLLLFLFVVFAIIGVQLFNGILHQQCFRKNYTDYPKDIWLYNETNWIPGEFFCHTPDTYSHNTSNGCGEDYPWCLSIAPNPNGGVTTFDNFGYAMLNVFVTISLEGWAAIQYKLTDAGATLCWLYFVLLTFIVGFFAANLCLAVIESVYGDEMEKKRKKEKKDDDHEKKAIKMTEKAWKLEKKKQYQIMQSPHPPSQNTNKSDNKVNDILLPNQSGTNIIITNENNQHIAGNNLTIHSTITAAPFDVNTIVDPQSPLDENELYDNNPLSLVKIDSYRLNYLGINGEEQLFGARLALSLPPTPQSVLSTDDNNIINNTKQNPKPPHNRSQSLANSPMKQHKLHNSGIMSLSGGLDVITDKNLENNNNNNGLNHHELRARVSLGKKNKNLNQKSKKNQNKTGMGTAAYMYRYRTGNLVQKEIKRTKHNKTNSLSNNTTPKHQKSTKNYLKNMGYLSANNLNLNDNNLKVTNNNNGTDDDLVTDEDFSDDNDNDNHKKSVKGTSGEDRKAKFAQSHLKRESRAHNKSSRSLSSIDLGHGRRNLFNSIRSIDYRNEGGEEEKQNFGSSLQRLEKHVKSSVKKKIQQDIKEYNITEDVLSKSFSPAAASGRGGTRRSSNTTKILDDHTFTDLPVTRKEQKANNKVIQSKEIKRRLHKAKEKRKANEIIARKAIYIADEKPAYMKYLDGKPPPIVYINLLVESPLFKNIIMFIIILNTIVLACVWPEQNKYVRSILEILNTFFTFIFIIEAILKLLGLGWRAYFLDNWNKFDFIIVVISIIEMLISYSTGGDGSSGGSAISALRSMRLLRAFRLLGKFGTLRKLFMLVVESMHEVSLLTMVLGIFIFMFAALAMSLFGGKLIALGDSRSGRWRFDNFYWSAVNVFMVISGDSWNEVMYDTVIATSSHVSTLYFIIVVCFGTFLILNLFVAILLSRMGSDETEIEFQLDALVKYSKRLYEMKIADENQVDRLVMSLERRKYISQLKDKRHKWKHHRDKEQIEGKSLGIFAKTNKFRIFCHTIVHKRWFEVTIDLAIFINCIFLALENPSASSNYPETFQTADIIFTIVFVIEFIIKVIALGAFQQPFRKQRSWTRIIDDESLIDYTDKSYQAIFFMSTEVPHSDILDLPGLAIECKKSNDGYHIIHVWGQQVLRVVYYENTFITAYKLIDPEKGIWKRAYLDAYNDKLDDELVTVLTSFDLTDHHHNAYFASNWNRLDAFVVLIAIIGVGMDSVSFLRALRAFRPFRIMVRFKKIKVVLGALIRAIPGLFNTILFCILFWFVLSILGVNWYSGLYRHCRIDDYDIYTNQAYNTTHTLSDLYPDENSVMYNFNKYTLDDYNVPGCDDVDGLIWWNSVFNFDNVFASLHSLFVCATLSGWNFVMYEAVDSTYINLHLIRDNREDAALYFVSIVILCSFFSLNLIVSVVVDNFNKIKAEKDGSAFQTEEQSLWVQNQKLLTRVELTPTFSAPKNCFRNLSFKIVENDYFDPFIMSCIILNAISMGAEHYDQSAEWTLALTIVDALFVTIFALEVVLKIAGYGFTLYILGNWNKFDFIISIVGVIGLVSNTGVGLNVLRLLRIGRLLRLLHKAKTLKTLFWTLVYSIPSLWNIGLLLFVIFFIYAVIGMHVLTEYPHELQSEVNADNFGNAFALLYRVGTEDGWTDVYSSYLEAYPEGERAKIYAYFLTFFVLGTLVLINLFIAVVLDSFDENSKSFSREDKFRLVFLWRDVWKFFDPDAKHEVTAQDFIDIIKLTPIDSNFQKKKSIKGPGFFKGNSIDALMKKTLLDKLKMNKGIVSTGTRIWRLSRNSLYGNNNNDNTNDREEDSICSNNSSVFDNNSDVDTNKSEYLSKKIQSEYPAEQRKQKLIELAQDVSNSDMLKLLMQYRLRVYRKEGNNSDLTCYGKLVKLFYELCWSMGIGSRADQGESLRALPTTRSKKVNNVNGHHPKTSVNDIDLTGIYSSDDDDDNDNNKSPNASASASDDDDDDNDDFDKDSKTWYLSYDEALLSICSEVIGPRLPDTFEAFRITNGDTQLKIEEWYSIKYKCIDTYKEIKLDIEKNKQYTDVLPSKPISDKKQKELQEKTKASDKFKVTREQFHKLTKQITTDQHNYIDDHKESKQNDEDNKEEDDDDDDDDNKDSSVVVIMDDDDDDDDDDEDDDDVVNNDENHQDKSKILVPDHSVLSLDDDDKQTNNDKQPNDK